MVDVDWDALQYNTAVRNAVFAAYIDDSTEIERYCGYNPQLLLTDQRSPLRKFADGVSLGEPYYHHGGRIRHLHPGEQIAMRPAGEFVIPNTSLLREQMESRLHRATTAPVYIAIHAQDRFTAKMKEVQEQVARWQEKVWLKMIFGTQIDSQPGDMFHREYRIGGLLFSTDRRKRKRGKRLFDKWHKGRSGINWTHDEKRELLRRGYGRGNYRKD